MNMIFKEDGNMDPNVLYARKYPQIIKYMGSKAKLLDFVVDGISEVYSEGVICDLFAGACSLSGAIGDQTEIISNDIQSYSSSLAHVYLNNMRELDVGGLINDVEQVVAKRIRILTNDVRYPKKTTLTNFNKIEINNRKLIDKSFRNKHHLFTKYYSGTWWTAEQCIWIDAIKEIADEYKFSKRINNSEYQFILSCLMHAMAYCSQGTGHYAQYRDAKTDSSMKDINIYRQKSIKDYFVRKFTSLLEWNINNVKKKQNKIWTLDYKQCLKKLPKCTVYADPPYAFVHYSRFYHAMETLVKYDYPKLQVKNGVLVKGRYREDRHQSPFCIKTQVKGAFTDMFEGVTYSKSNLVLSYSNTAMLELWDLLALARDVFGNEYEIWAEDTEHSHMTMGRSKDRSRAVKEALIMAKRK